MKNKIMIMIIAAGILLTTSPYFSFAEMVNVGNKICPVSNQTIGSMGEGYKVEYNGKEYNLCCEMCVKDFNKNPEKYAAIAEAEEATAHDMDGDKTQQMHGDHGHHDHHAH